MGEFTVEMKRTAAMRVAIVAGVFSVIVAFVMLANFSRRLKAEPAMENQIADMKNVFREQPDNEALAEQIRKLDLQMRHSRMRWLAFSGKGAVMLLCGLGIVICALKYASSLKGTVPVVEGDAVDGLSQERRAVLSRRFVAGGIAVLLFSGVLIGLIPSVEYIVEDTWPEFLAGWPTFRGPDGSGVSRHSDVLLEFDVESGAGVMWKSPVPMAGMNSPVLWGERVFLSGADEEHMQVYCYDTVTGQMVWTRDVESISPEDAEIEPMEDTGFAAPTMAVDGKRVYAVFATGDAVAFDFSGKKVWGKYLGVPDYAYGFASSLTMYKKTLIVQYDQGMDDDDLSKLYALDGFTGQPVWQVNRKVANSWASPVVVDFEGSRQIVTFAKPHVITYDAATGQELWRFEFDAEDIAPSPVAAGGVVVAIMPNDQVIGIKMGGSGDVTESHLAWENDEIDVPDICSPVSDGELLFMLSTGGTLSCIDVKDGKTVWDHDLEEGFQASPSIVDGKLVLLSEKGNLVVAEVGREYKEISRSKLGERCYASPAFADGRMYIRTVKNIYCIGKKD